MEGSEFRLDTVRPTRRLDHINVSEMLSFGEAEHLATGDHPASERLPTSLIRPLIGTDSQVLAACVAKGRCSSPV